MQKYRHRVVYQTMQILTANRSLMKVGQSLLDWGYCCKGKDGPLRGGGDAEVLVA